MIGNLFLELVKFIKSIEFRIYFFSLLLAAGLSHDYYALGESFYPMIAKLLESRFFLLASLILLIAYMARVIDQKNVERTVRFESYLKGFIFDIFTLLIISLVMMGMMVIISYVFYRLVEGKAFVRRGDIAEVEEIIKEFKVVCSFIKGNLFFTLIQYVLGLASFSALILFLSKRFDSLAAKLTLGAVSFAGIYNLIFPFTNPTGPFFKRLLVSSLPLNLMSSYYSSVNLGLFISPVIFLAIGLILVLLYLVNKRGSTGDSSFFKSMFFSRFIVNKTRPTLLALVYILVVYVSYLNNIDLINTQKSLSPFMGYGTGYFLPIEFVLFIIAMTGHIFPVVRFLELESEGAFSAYLPRFTTKKNYIKNLFWEINLSSFLYILVFSLLTVASSYILVGEVEVLVFLKMLITRVLEMVFVTNLLLLFYSLVKIPTADYFLLVASYCVVFLNFKYIIYYPLGISSIKRYLQFDKVYGDYSIIILIFSILAVVTLAAHLFKKRLR